MEQFRRILPWSIKLLARQRTNRPCSCQWAKYAPPLAPGQARHYKMWLIRGGTATIDRLLKKTRARYPAKGLSGTRSGQPYEHLPRLR